MAASRTGADTPSISIMARPGLSWCSRGTPRPAMRRTMLRYTESSSLSENKLVKNVLIAVRPNAAARAVTGPEMFKPWTMRPASNTMDAFKARMSRPNDSTVNGMVSRSRIGRTSALRRAITTMAHAAVGTPSTSRPGSTRANSHKPSTSTAHTNTTRRSRIRME
jgi:hypothetical protein